jgi:hypothetical protein
MTFSAETILEQLGGRRFIAMTGAKQFIKWDAKKMITFKIPKGKDGIRFIMITLNGKDLYDMEFQTLSGRTVKKVNDVYNDQLQEIFTENTGLYTHL